MTYILLYSCAQSAIASITVQAKKMAKGTCRIRQEHHESQGSCLDVLFHPLSVPMASTWNIGQLVLRATHLRRIHQNIPMANEGAFLNQLEPAITHTY